MTAIGILVLGAFLLLLLCRIPIAIAAGALAGVVFLRDGRDLTGYASSLYGNMARFQLMAIPLYILAGLLLERAGIANRLLNLAIVLVGRVRGALALSAVLCCLVFAGMTGSGPADTAAVGALLIPVMVRHGYDRAFTAALLAAAGSTAIIIPPSIAFVVYSQFYDKTSEVTVRALFLAGLFPGLLLGLCLLVPAYWLGRHQEQLDPAARHPTWSQLLRALRESAWGLGAPVIILGGLYSGLFTATEAASVAVLYSLLLGTVVYRSLRWRDLWEVLINSAVSSAVVMFIVGFMGTFALACQHLGMTELWTRWLMNMHIGPALAILVIHLVLFVADVFLDAISIYMFLLPVLRPVVEYYHWDPIWFGVVMTVNLAIGQVTPPVAVNLFVAAHQAEASIERVSRASLPFLAAMLVALLIITYWPALSTFLPRMQGMMP